MQDKNISFSKNGNKMTNVRKITLSGIIIGIYILIMFLTQNFAFGQYQVRIATSLYSLSALFPFLIIPLGIANFLSNTIMGGLGLPDMIGGMLAGFATTYVVYIIKKFNLNDWLISLPIVFIPGLMVPIWLSYSTHVPYKILAISLCIGQIIPAVFGVIFVKELRKVLNKQHYNFKL